MSEGKTIQTVVYYRGEQPEPGCVVIIDRKTETGAREEVQRFTLEETGGEENEHNHGQSFKLTWSTRCTECSKAFTCTTNNYTKNLPRRCKPCRRKNPYNAAGWMTRPRNRYVRVDPESASPSTAEYKARRRSLYEEIRGAHPEMPFTWVATEIERRMSEADDIDPASLF